jgi:hypothetical protein
VARLDLRATRWRLAQRSTTWRSFSATAKGPSPFLMRSTTWPICGGCSSRAAIGCWRDRLGRLAQRHTPIGSLICPHDFIVLHLGLSVFADERAFSAPGFDPAWRSALCAARGSAGRGLRDVSTTKTASRAGVHRNVERQSFPRRPPDSKLVSSSLYSAAESSCKRPITPIFLFNQFFLV